MVLDMNRKVLYVTVYMGVAKIIMESLTIQSIPSIYSTRLQTTGITRLPFTEILIVTHRGNHSQNTGNKITQLYGTNMTPKGDTVCTGEFGKRNGDLRTCQIHFPSSIRYSHYLGALVIGSHQYIRLLNIDFNDGKTSIIVCFVLKIS